MTFLEGDTAAERIQPRGLNSALSSLTHSVKPDLSEAGPAVQLVWKSIETNEMHGAQLKNCRWFWIRPYLPACGILPIEVEPIESVFLDEADDVFDEPLSGGRVVD